MKEFPRVYPITDRSISGLSNLEQARRMMEGGARLVQIRDKTASSIDLYNSVSAIVTLAADYGTSIIVNDRADIALAAGAAGVHLGQDDLSPEYVREILGPEAVIGYSTHSVTQAINAPLSSLSYIAIGPVFPTVTKEDADPVVGLEGVSAVRSKIGDLPLVAIGGIDLANFRHVLAAGADSVAVIGSILSGQLSINESVARYLS